MKKEKTIQCTACWIPDEEERCEKLSIIKPILKVSCLVIIIPALYLLKKID